MKKILFVLIVLAACKKETIEPVKLPELPAETKCKTADTTRMCGQWFIYHPSLGDTITVRFLKNDCPNEGSNYYILKGFGKAVQPFLKPGKSCPVEDFTIKFNQTDSNINNWNGGFFGTPQFSLRLNYYELIIAENSTFKEIRFQKFKQ